MTLAVSLSLSVCLGCALYSVLWCFLATSTLTPQVRQGDQRALEVEKCPSLSWDRLWKVSPGERALVLEGALSIFTSDDSSFPWQRPFFVLHSENLLWFLAVKLVGGGPKTMVSRSFSLSC